MSGSALRWTALPGTPRTIDLDTVLASTPVVLAEPVPGTTTALGEHPVWEPATGTLLRVDVDAGLVLRHRPDGGDTVVHRASGPVGAALPHDGGIWVLGADGLVDLEPTGPTARTLGPPPPAHLRFNDAGLAPDGWVWAGVLPIVDPAPHEEPTGALLRLDPVTGTSTTVLTAMGCPNGIVWSGDARTMWVCESDTRRLAVADYADGQATGWRVVWQFTGGDGAMPDGMELAPDGRLWIAFWGWGAVVRFGPDGTAELVVLTDDPRTTSMCTAPDGTLWLTTAAGLCRLRP